MSSSDELKMGKATKDHYLPALQMNIEVPRCVDVRETYLEVSKPGHAEWTTSFEHLQRRWTLELQWGIERNLYNERGLRFVRGHEEGHLCEDTGNWMRLYEEAEKLGLTYDFFTREEAHESDERVRIIIKKVARRGRPFNGYPHGPIGRSEMIAHVAGLVALVKAEGKSVLANEIDRKLRVVSFVVPKIPEVVLEYCAREA